MLYKIICCLLLISSPCYAINDAAVLNFSARVKAEIEKVFVEGRQRYDYDKGNIVRTWKDKNISTEDMKAYLRAYNFAHDLERKVRLSNDLKAAKYLLTDFPEHVTPIIPFSDPRK